MRLTVELVPRTCWFSNVRSEVTKKQWETIRSAVASKAYNLCEICGGVGPKHPVECHEIWDYDDKNCIQTLKGMIALCPNCHSVKHFGFAQISGRGDKALRHLMKINNLDKSEAKRYISDVFLIWQNRSAKQWSLDLSALKEFNIDVDNITLK